MISPVDFTRDRQPVYDYGPSPAIWSDCPVLEFEDNPGKGFHRFEDFKNCPVLTTPTITTDANYGNGFHAFGSSGGTVVRANLEGGGGLILTETDDNEGIALQYLQTPFKLAPGKGDLWFEARLKIGTVTDNDSGFFVGLAESLTLTATVPITAAGAIADKNVVGFHRLEGDGDQIDTVYKADGVTQVTVKADALSTTAGVHTAAGSLAADTYIKLGMKYVARNNTLYFYVNNVRLNDYKVLPSAAGTDFPNDVLLAPTLGLLCGSNNDSVLTLSYLRFAQRLVA